MDGATDGVVVRRLPAEVADVGVRHGGADCNDGYCRRVEMSWARFVPGFSRHPKRVKCGPVASWLWVCSVDHCHEYLTDGFLDAAAVPTLCPAIRGKALTQAVATLIGVGSWEPYGGGYIVHGYLEHNPSRAQVEAERQASRRRYERWRGQRPDDAESNGVRNATTTPLPTALQRKSNATSVSQSVSHKETTPEGVREESPHAKSEATEQRGGLLSQHGQEEEEDRMLAGAMGLTVGEVQRRKQEARQRATRTEESG